MVESIKLSDEEINKKVAKMDGWSLKNGHLVKEFSFSDFDAAIQFVNSLAIIAEKQNHHPDIHIYYHKVALEYWTHSAGGLTVKDFEAAQTIEKEHAN